MKIAEISKKKKKYITGLDADAKENNQQWKLQIGSRLVQPYEN